MTLVTKNDGKKEQNSSKEEYSHAYIEDTHCVEVLLSLLLDIPNPEQK